MARACVPSWVAGPACSAHGAARRLRVDGAFGNPWRPASGILPGCALAVYVLRLLLAPWETAVQDASDVARRDY
eukprot:1516218-Lingulodinium_polyedra.AAC.1